MNKRHYKWWGYVKSVIQVYPYRIGDADLSGVAKREFEAVQAAIVDTERMENGQNRLKVIRLLHWSNPQTLTLDGAAGDIPCDRSTAARWQRRFFEEVARNRGLLD